MTSHLLTAVLGFAVLFALAGLYALLRPSHSCAAGGCGSCASAERCAVADLPAGEAGDAAGQG